MNLGDDKFENLIDRAVSATRVHELPEDALRAAGDRVWAKLQRQQAAPGSSTSPAAPTVIEGCAAFQGLMPAALDGALSPARKILLDDHLSACPNCRRQYKRLSSGLAVVSTTKTTSRSASAGTRGWFKYAAAASAAVVVLTLGITQRSQILQLFGKAVPSQALLTFADAGVLRVADGGTEPLAQGAVVHYGETVRAPKDHGALLTLQDGSRVELRERTELTLSTRGSDTDIELQRGNIIVEASKQGSGHLWVTTPDAKVSVVGTVFTVNYGVRGSRVSVLEGEVHVDHATVTNVLKPGDQVSTMAAVDRVPFDDEIAWSRNREQHEALVDALRQLSQDIAALPGQPSRRSTQLLDLMPRETAIYGAIPNISGTVADAHQLFLSRMASNPVLAQWWQEHHASEVGRVLDESIGRIKALGEQVGDEVAVGGVVAADGSPSGFLVLTTLRHASDFPSFLQQQLATVPHGQQELPLQLITDPALLATIAPQQQHRLLLLTVGDYLAASVSPPLLQEFAAKIQGAADDGSFRGSAFHQALADRYAGGVVWLGGADLERLVHTARTRTAERSTALDNSGFLAVRHLIVESRGEEYQAQLDFNGPRQSIAAWLAEPAPMGAVDFISPQANLAFAAVFKDPSTMLDDVARIMEGEAKSLADMLADVRQHVGVDIAHDLVGALGGEMAFAIDGPVLPVPAWKFVVEVYDAPRLQRSLETMITRFNSESAARGGIQLTLSSQSISGQVVYSVSTSDGKVGISYTYTDGYLVAASQAAVLERALSERAAGLTLTRSAGFTKLLPKGQTSDMSAFLYTNMGELMRRAADASASSGINEEQRKQLSALAAAAAPSLQWVYGAAESITIGSSATRLGPLSLPALLGAPLMQIHGDTDRPVPVEPVPIDAGNAT